MTIRRDIRGAVFAEVLIAMMPVLTLAMCIFQEASLFEAQLLTEHAAFVAVRAASVVVPDAPARYGGEAANTLGPNRRQAVRIAAIHALAPLVQNEEVSSVDVDLGGTGTVGVRSPITVKVDAVFRCKVPLAAQLVCERDGTRALSASATMPNEGARYAYAE